MPSGDAYRIVSVLRGAGFRSRADLARYLDKNKGALGIKGIGPKRMADLRTTMRSQGAWEYFFGTLLPWEGELRNTDPVSDVVYHECSAPIERVRQRVGKEGEHTVTLYYPLREDGSKEPIAESIGLCPLCRGALYSETVDVVPGISAPTEVVEAGEEGSA